MKLEWTEPALSDLECIRDYIKWDSEYYANLFVERIIDAVERLINFPELGRRVPEAEKENIRELLFHNYRIIYRVDCEEIELHVGYFKGMLEFMDGSIDTSRRRIR